MTQTYCTKTDIEAIWPPASLLASVDDDTTGTLSPTEDGYITRAIERAANLINARLAMRYKLVDLAANTWCRDANAAIAAYWLSTRRTGTAPAHLQQQYDAYVGVLDRIVTGHLRVPEAAESFDAGPGVSNFAIHQNVPVVVPPSMTALGERPRRAYHSRLTTHRDQVWSRLRTPS